MQRFSYFLLTFFYCFSINAQTNMYQERYRPQFHFSPPSHWMNDPNGMVYYKGEYHLFYQYYPDSTVWGPMHWGHAISNDLVSWKHLPIALLPDSLGYIFSGSVVVDKTNSSGFQQGKESPLIAIYTYHNIQGEKEGSLRFQTQGIAYSLDRGRTWTKYKSNPVLRNPGKKDFRDPKVFWHAGSKYWVMSLAVGNKIEFYRSVNLKDWKLTGSFGEKEGSHGGVWECPDLFPIAVSNTGLTKWVLLVSIGSGGPNEGSATQYFVGDFDGNTFTNDNPAPTTLWLDEGCDNYAGVTWNNTPQSKRIFLGWMSNWQYAQVVPTGIWRSAMTLPRELSLIQTKYGIYLTSKPIKQLESLRRKKEMIPAKGLLTTPALLKEVVLEFEVEKNTATEAGLLLSNNLNEELKIGFDNTSGKFFIDRTKAGSHLFYPSFGRKQSAARKSKAKIIKLHLFIDRSSIEVFADDGLTLLTSTFFPTEDFTSIRWYEAGSGFRLLNSYCYQLATIW
jgi:fructan beta-fructosidase